MSEFDCDKHQEDKDEIWACLSCYNAGVAREERERIIKLLEEEGVLRPARWGYDAEIIALIKGENK